MPQFLRGGSAPTTKQALSGPTGEENLYNVKPKQHIVCFGPNAEADATWAKSLGVGVKVMTSASALAERDDIELVIGSGPDLAALRKTLAQRDGPIVQVRARDTAAPLLFMEKSVCIDITAAGGNVDLLGA